MNRNRRNRMFFRGAILAACLGAVLGSQASAQHSIAREWDEALLGAIRMDFARPPIHARNLYHVSVAMWDAWAAYDDTASQVIHQERAQADDIQAAREEAISFAAYRLLKSRFVNSPNAAATMVNLDAKMEDLGYDKDFTSTEGNTPAALGNRIAASIIEYGLNDGSNQQGNYANQYYMPVNTALVPALPGAQTLEDPNRWQPLAFDFFIDQSGNVVPGGPPPFVGAEWGNVKPFALKEEELVIYTDRNGDDYWVYHDPGPPPMLGGEGDEEYRSGFEQVVLFSSQLDPTVTEMIDISPASRGNNTLGTNDGTGRDINPVTGEPYEPQMVPAGDYYRVLAEFWADGPQSETPPGHWHTIANHVSDDPDLVKRIQGVGPVVDDLEWDVKLYLTLSGTLHDVAISAWGIKGWYDYVRPISAIRYMAGMGQSSDEDLPSYDPNGIRLYPGVIELITEETIAPGERHEHLAGEDNENVGKIAFFAWRGPEFIDDPDVDEAGVGWILSDNWWPYQRPTFVTPPFAGYISGHSTFSRAAARVMHLFTGSEYFPGGMGTFLCPQNEFLVFEEGPSMDVTLQWATYYDASDETSLSRIYGGIHPTQDDIPGRLIGHALGDEGMAYALSLFAGTNGNNGPPGCASGATSASSRTGGLATLLIAGSVLIWSRRRTRA